MDYPDDLEPLRAGFGEIRDRDSFDVFRRESMQVDRVGYLELDRFGKWVVRFFVDGWSLFVVRCSLFVVRRTSPCIALGSQFSVLISQF